MSAFAFFVIALGVIVLLFGNRLALFGAGVGALLGIGVLWLIPGSQTNWIWWLVPIGLALLFAFGAGYAKGMVSLVTLGLGALAGAAVALAALDLFGVGGWLLQLVLALVGAGIGAGLLSQFKEWTLIVLSALIGAFLVVRGLQMLNFVEGTIGSIVAILLAGGAIVYHGGFLKK